jgi:hypothetical protein
MALRIQGWCVEEEAEPLIEATLRRQLAWIAALSDNQGLRNLHSTAADLRAALAYIFAIVGGCPLECRRGGERLDETALWNAYADLLVGLAKVTRCTFGWTLTEEHPRPVLGPVPPPGPMAARDLAPHDAVCKLLHDEWEGLLPRLMALVPKAGCQS